MMKDTIDTDLLDLGDERLPKPRRVGVSRRGMIATAHYRATEAGVEILEGGGNAVDAAVASALALGVCEPAASGLGGQTMALVTLGGEGRTVALDGSSRAPNRAMPGLLGSAEVRRGYRASTVPSTPATLSYLIERFGKLDWATVIGPAIRLAEQGFLITQLQHDLTRRELKHLRERSAGAIFLKDGRVPYPVGSLFKQPALASTLKRLARWGVKSFYAGRIARTLVADMDLHGGLIRRDDLAQVPWPLERRPLSCRFENMRVLTFPPPGAGRTLVEMLNILSNFSAKERAPGTAQGAVLLASVIRQAFRDRTDRPRDPDFYAQVEEKKMLSRGYAEKVARSVRRSLKKARAGSGETTHLSTADSEGNVVALTQSIERVYGSCEASPELGFLYNNYMSAFEYENIGHPYNLRPNAVPWASVAPTIVFRGRRPWLAIGSPGSERITPSIVQVLLRLDKQSPYEAVEAPRLHCSLDGVVSLEASRMRSDIPDILRKHGFEFKERDPYSFYLGCVQLVMRDRRGFIGVADPRRDGSAGGTS